MANFIPPLGMVQVWVVIFVLKIRLQPKNTVFFSPFCFASLEIIGVMGSKFVTDRQTDGQTNSLTPFTGVCRFFLSVNFATSLLA